MSSECVCQWFIICFVFFLIVIGVQGLLTLDSKTGTLSRTTAMLQLRLTLVGGIRARKQRGKRLKVQVEWCHTEEVPQVAVMMYVVHVAVHIHSCMQNWQLSWNLHAWGVTVQYKQTDNAVRTMQLAVTNKNRPTWNNHLLMRAETIIIKS